jgi:CubicO group peptidase (beta-lactamase class C family)
MSPRARPASRPGGPARAGWGHAALVALALAAPLAAPLAGCGPPALDVPLRGDRFDVVRRVVREEAKRHHVTSLAIAVARDGRIVLEEAYGWADRERGVRATPRSVYALASITKAMTATGLMVLAERGALDLDRPVNDYLAPPGLTACAGRAGDATVLRVARFTSGLPYYVNLFDAGSDLRPPPTTESIHRYGIIASEPGREYQYSNLAYGVLDQVIERVSGRDYAAFMRDEVFAPLGLSSTSIGVDSTLRDLVVRGYGPDGRPVPAWDTDHAGASAAHASVHDLVRFGMFHLGDRLDGQRPILDSRALARLHEPDSLAMPDESVGAVHAAMGWAVVDLAGQRFLIATGGAEGTVTRLALLPARDVAVAIVMNIGDEEGAGGWNVEWQALAAALDGDFPAQPAIPSPRPTATFVPDSLLGTWTGSLRTPGGTLPVQLSFRGRRDAWLTVGGEGGGPIWAPNPLGTLHVRDGVLEGPFLGRLPIADARRGRHVLAVRLRIEDDHLRGTISAVALDRHFCLPCWVELTRRRA